MWGEQTSRDLPPSSDEEDEPMSKGLVKAVPEALVQANNPNKASSSDISSGPLNRREREAAEAGVHASYK